MILETTTSVKVLLPAAAKDKEHVVAQTRYQFKLQFRACVLVGGKVTPFRMHVAQELGLTSALPPSVNDVQGQYGLRHLSWQNGGMTSPQLDSFS